MFQFGFYGLANFTMQIIMYMIFLVGFVYMSYKNRRDNLSLLLILLFFQAPFIFLGNMVHNLYKVVVLGYTGYCFLQRKAIRLNGTRDWLYTISFLLFTVAFFVSILHSGRDSITIIFSQYARYVEVFCLFFLLKDAIYQRNEAEKYVTLFYQLFLVQIFATIVKLLFFSFRQIEGMVGTFSIDGGAIGTTIPILGFIVLFLYRGGKFSRWDWLYVAGLLLIGFATGKRAIWFILPFVIAACLVYVRGMKMNRYLVLGLCIVPVVFYFGARLTPTLNPENKVWGSFDLAYMFDYAEQYQFGDKGLESFRTEQQQIGMIGGNIISQKEISAYGRGNATIELVRLIFSGNMTEQDWYGLGLAAFYSTNYEEFQELPLTIKLGYKGAGTGAFQAYTTIGVLGLLTMSFFCFLPIFFIKHRRLRWVMFGILAWEYFMYAGSIFRDQALMATVLFIVFYSNCQYYQARAAMNNLPTQERKAELFGEVR